MSIDHRPSPEETLEAIYECRKYSGHSFDAHELYLLMGAIKYILVKGEVSGSYKGQYEALWLELHLGLGHICETYREFNPVGFLAGEGQ